MDGEEGFKKLLEPFHIGQVQTRNRMVKTAAGTGYLIKQDKAYYEALAKGGVGLLIIQLTTVFEVPDGPRIPFTTDDKYWPDLIELVQSIHEYNCPVFLQFMTGGGAWDPRGRWGLGGRLEGRWGHVKPDAISSSALSENELPGAHFVVPREITIAEIKKYIDEGASLAVRAQKAGFDGVEINHGTCHLGNAFLSGFWNRRQDAYGCSSLENRARFSTEIIREIKKRTGRDFPVSILINGAEFGVDRGITVEESQGLAQILQDAGADAIHVRVYGYYDYAGMLWPEQALWPERPKSLAKELDYSHKGRGASAPIAAAIKQVVSIPVISVGRHDPILGEKILQEGKADFIGMTRRLLADPELPNKIAAGRLEDIAPCMACLGCASARIKEQPTPCRVNAALGGDQEYYEIKPAQQKKKVVVVGGGPAGMEAARVAALRGHEVILYEKEPKLGGLLPLASLVKGLEIEDLPGLVRYLKTQITKLGVKIKQGQEVTPTLIEEIKPDVVILATGGIPAVPDIPGINRRNVVGSAELHRRVKTYLRFFGPQVLRWLTKFWMPIGKSVVIIGGQIQGCELAEFLIKRGRKVTIVDMADTIGEGLSERLSLMFFPWLSRKGATTITGVRYEEITDRGLTITTREGERQTIEADTIVTAAPHNPNTELRESLESKVPEIYAIGDCIEPRLIIDAIADGYRIARAL